MPYRGYFLLNGQEIANSSRVASHLGVAEPVRDAGLILSSIDDCGLTEATDHQGLFHIPADSYRVMDGLYSPPNGARRYGPGLFEMDGSCWEQSGFCGSCTTEVLYDDTWPGIGAFTGDLVYRNEVAPWYQTQVPESAEFGGIWVMNVSGFGAPEIDRDVQESAGPGGSATKARDKARKLQFTALLVACTNAGLEYGIKWLSRMLRSTNDNEDSVLRYLAAHPGHSGVDPTTLIREAHRVILSKGLTVGDTFNSGRQQNQQATSATVQWELTQLHPYNYYAPEQVPVFPWDDERVLPVAWMHAADCGQPAFCEDMPVMFGTECEVRQVDIVKQPPPSCGGCMPVCEVVRREFRPPVMDNPFRGKTAVSMAIINASAEPLSLQAFWRVCDTDIHCDDNRWPLQVAGLPPGTTLVLDGIKGRFYAIDFDGRKRRLMGVVGTPDGSPWRPPLIDRRTCWEFVCLSNQSARFSVGMTMYDREE